jgi:hypothetical protein
MTGGAASSVREGGSASGCARTGRVIGLCVLLGRASAARLQERLGRALLGQAGGGEVSPSCGFVFLFQKCE